MIISLLVLAIWLAFVLRVDTDIILADQFPLILDYENLRSGNYGLSELWAAKAGHRLPGYKLLFFLNCFLFGFSASIEIMAAAAIYMVMAAIMSLKMTDKLGFERPVKWLILGVFVLLWFNGQTLRVSSFSLIAMRLANLAGFVCLVYLAISMVMIPHKNSSKQWAGFIIAVLIFILLFGRGWGMAASAGLVAVLIVDWAASRLRPDGTQSTSAKTHIGLIAILAAAMIIYLIGINNQNLANQTDVTFGSFLKFLSAKAGHAYISLIGTDISRIPLLAAITTGGLAIMTGIASVLVLRKSGRNLTDMIALFLIYFSVFALIMVSLSRHDDTPFYQRHNLEIAIGAIGFVYFLFQVIGTVIQGQAKHYLAAAVSLCLIVLLSRNLLVNFKAGEVLRADIDRKEQLQQAATGQELVLSKQDYKEMACNLPPKYCRTALEVMEKHGIGKADIKSVKSKRPK